MKKRVMEYGAIGEECWASSCREDATHLLTTKILKTSVLPAMKVKSGYCLEHALYFAAWLPYCYPGEQELVSIEPPAAKLFGR